MGCCNYLRLGFPSTQKLFTMLMVPSNPKSVCQQSTLLLTLLAREREKEGRPLLLTYEQHPEGCSDLAWRSAAAQKVAHAGTCPAVTEVYFSHDRRALKGNRLTFFDMRGRRTDSSGSGASPRGSLSKHVLESCSSHILYCSRGWSLTISQTFGASTTP